MNSYQNVLTGQQELVDNIKILLYKEKRNIFDWLNFEEDLIYQEPLLFAYFKNQQENKLFFDSILFGYTENQLKPKSIEVKSNELGIIYLAKVGWFHTKKSNHVFELKYVNNTFELNDEERCEFRFEPITLIKGTSIELLKYPIELLNQFYYDQDLNRVHVEVLDITEQHTEHLAKAFKLIKEYVPKHYRLIEQVVKKIVIFNVDTILRNSFASLSAQGIAFFNAYQKEYNEVFFIDDIAHQTGHIIFNALIYNISDFIKVNPETVVEEIIGSDNRIIETRDIHVVFHALYTYYTTFLCLDAVYSANVLDEKKQFEALGRMKFYIGKCKLDLMLIDEKVDALFTEKGLAIYSKIKTQYIIVRNKYSEESSEIRLENQLYNFTISRFLELNT